MTKTLPLFLPLQHADVAYLPQALYVIRLCHCTKGKKLAFTSAHLTALDISDMLYLYIVVVSFQDTTDVSLAVNFFWFERRTIF